MKQSEYPFQQTGLTLHQVSVHWVAFVSVTASQGREMYNTKHKLINNVLLLTVELELSLWNIYIYIYIYIYISYIGEIVVEMRRLGCEMQSWPVHKQYICDVCRAMLCSKQKEIRLTPVTSATTHPNPLVGYIYFYMLVSFRV